MKAKSRLFEKSIIAVAIVLNVILALVTFSHRNNPAESSSRTSNSARKPSAKILNLTTWEDYVAPEVIEEFTKRTGINVNFTPFENTEELIGQLRAYSHRYDVVIFDDGSIQRLSKMKLLKKLQHNQLPSFSNLDPKFTDLNSDPRNEYSVPYLWGSTLVAYRKDKIPEPEPSFNLLFDESLRGKIWMLDDAVELFAVAHILQGRSINSFDEADIRNAARLLKEQVRTVGARHASDKQIKDALISGECWAAMCYSGDAAWIAEDHEQIGYFFPKEGASLWLDVMGISHDTQNLDAAHQFIEFMLEPEIIAMNSNSLWYANPNAKAQSLLSEELLSDEALFPPKSVLNQCEFFKVTPPKVTSLMGKFLRDVRTEQAEGIETAASIVK